MSNKTRGLRAKIGKDLRREMRLADIQFKEKFGRKPTSADPLLWDPNADTPMPMSEEYLRKEMLKAMKQSGIDPKLIYLFEKTGRILIQETYEELSPADRAEYDAYADEYDAMELKSVFNPQ